MDYQVTECCEEDILYQHRKDGTMDMWEFCPQCLEPFKPQTKQGGTYASK